MYSSYMTIYVTNCNSTRLFLTRQSYLEDCVFPASPEGWLAAFWPSTTWIPVWRGFTVSGWEVDTDEVQFRDPEIHQGTAVARVRGARVRRSQHRSRPRWFFLRGARRAVSVLIWIACAVAPPYGRAEVSHSGGYATVTAGDTTRMARERMVREQIGGRG